MQWNNTENNYLRTSMNHFSRPTYKASNHERKFVNHRHRSLCNVFLRSLFIKKQKRQTPTSIKNQTNKYIKQTTSKPNHIDLNKSSDYSRPLQLVS